jgi:hypothetical protein
MSSDNLLTIASTYFVDEWYENEFTLLDGYVSYDEKIVCK